MCDLFIFSWMTELLIFYCAQIEVWKTKLLYQYHSLSLFLLKLQKRSRIMEMMWALKASTIQITHSTYKLTEIASVYVFVCMSYPYGILLGNKKKEMMTHLEMWMNLKAILFTLCLVLISRYRDVGNLSSFKLP